MSELANRLRKIQEQGMSLRDLEEKSRIDGTIMASKSAIREVINDPSRKPRITTLLGIAKALDLPLWQVIAMAGYDLGLPEESQTWTELQALAQRDNDARLLLDLLLKASEEDRKAVLNYLRVRSPA
ncbi:helix-turn-helix transcriptional regulator [Chloroflexia bacterium SDU3-3]|nr:helix-turn-helix transcriptional regulator [Chloroflexia bacterium SDU3-3]